MKTNLSKKQYQLDDDVISAVEDYFENQKEILSKMRIQMLKHHWNKCVECKGDYVEK